MTVEIRRAGPGEEAAVSALLAEVWHATHDAQLGHDKVAKITAKWHAPALLRAQIEDPGKCFLVAEAGGGELVGHAISWLDEDTAINLLRLYVLPSMQGRGLGGRLLRAAEAARALGFVAIEGRGVSLWTAGIRHARWQGELAAHPSTSLAFEIAEPIAALASEHDGAADLIFLSEPMPYPCSPLGAALARLGGRVLAEG